MPPDTEALFASRPDGRTTPDLQGSEFEFVIIGGGAVGCGVAYSLAKAGKTDVLLIERADDVGEVTTSQGAGLAGQLRATVERTKLAMHSVQTFRELESRAEVKPDWNEVGSLRIGLSDEAAAQFGGLRLIADRCGLECELIGLDEAKARWPPMCFDEVKAVLWCPSDGYMLPKSVVRSYRHECQRMGVRFATGTAVETIDVNGGRVNGVRTNRGEVRCRYVINAAGAHAYHIAMLVGLELPIVPVRHEYFVTVALAGLDPQLPCFRIPDLTLYGRVDDSGMLLGGWEATALATDPRSFSIENNAPLIEPDWDVLGSFESKIADLFPSSHGAEKSRVGKGWPTFPPDGKFIIGESSQVPGFVMAGGCNAHGISGSGGIGRLLVESLFDESPSEYVTQLSPDRFTETEWDWREARVQARRIYETYYGIES